MATAVGGWAMRAAATRAAGVGSVEEGSAAAAQGPAMVEVGLAEADHARYRGMRSMYVLARGKARCPCRGLLLPVTSQW